MKRWRRPITLLLGSLLAATTFNVQATYREGQVERIVPTYDSVLFRLKDDEACNQGGGDYFFRLANNHAKAWLALLIEAASTGGKVTVNLDSCAPLDQNKEINYLYRKY